MRLFQFQYGAIRSLIRGMVLNGLSGFNSNMVRLEAIGLIPESAKILFVSIPIWCD